MTSDLNKPAQTRWWKRPAFLVTSPIVLGLLAWISTGADVFQTVGKPAPLPDREAGSQDHIFITNLPAAGVPPVEVSPAPPPAAVRPNVEPRAVEPDLPVAATHPAPRQRPPVLSSARRESRIDAPADQAPEPESEWFDEAEGAVLDRRPTMVHRLAATSSQRMCVPRISTHYGVAGGIVSNALTRAGNPNCVQATYGDIMSLVVEPCGGELTEISQIEVERGAFLEDGRPRTYAASLSYSLIANGQETLPLPLGTGGYRRVQSVQFSPVRASAVRVTLRSPRTRGYAIYQRLCSIVVR